MIDWSELKVPVQIMQGIINNALETGDQAALDFLDATHNATAPRIKMLQEMGIDVTDDATLFVYCAGYAQATTVAHHVTHAYDFRCHDEEVDEDDECGVFIDSTIANLLPLMSLLPISEILGITDGEEVSLDDILNEGA